MLPVPILLAASLIDKPLGGLDSFPELDHARPLVAGAHRKEGVVILV